METKQIINCKAITFVIEWLPADPLKSSLARQTVNGQVVSPQNGNSKW